MPDRAVALTTFIKKSGWGHADRSVLAMDASSRRYHRLVDPETSETAVLMDAPPCPENATRSYVEITRFLRKYHFSAPEIYAMDLNAGFLLVEDLGDDLFAKLCNTMPDLEPELYAAAIDLLLELHQKPIPAGVAPYSDAVYLREARLLTEWYLPATGANVSQAELSRFDSLITKACALVSTDRPVLVQRDYHAENLLWLPDRVGSGQVGLLDFQDALIGHPAYDLVSLLEDARRDTSTGLRADMLARYLQGSACEPEAFTRAYHILGAQRNIKIIGIFSRLARRDKKQKYLDLIPRVWDHLQNDLTHPALADLRDWIANFVPVPTSGILARLAHDT